MARFGSALACALLGGAMAATPALAAAPSVRSGAPVSSHAMLYTCCTPAAMKERMFAESKAMGARFLRVDVELAGIFRGAGPAAGPPNWEGLDHVMELSRRHDLPVLGILMRPPAWLEPSDAGQFGRLAGEVAAHARGTITRWEVLNEPDHPWGAFAGTPEDYAWMLRAAFDEITTRVPEAEVVMGGVVAGWSGNSWLERMLATPGARAPHAFDIASVHLRGSARGVARELVAWRGLLVRHGFSGPVWVTEHGYPADLQWQSDPGFRGGERAQAAYLTESILALADAGATEVFVTLRDNFSGMFASEGVISIDDGANYPVRRKAAFGAMRRLVDDWVTLAAAYAERADHEEARRLALAGLVTAMQNVKAQRALARAARVRLTRLTGRVRQARRPQVRARLAVRVERAVVRLRERRDGVGWAKASAADYRGRAALHGLRAAELAAFVAG
jgi:hypothetical protein